MKRIVPVILCLVALLMGFFVGKYTRKLPQESVLESYTEIIQGQMPEDIRLTIYMMDSDILYSLPVSREKLLTRPHEKVVVGSEELAPYWETFQEIKPSALQPVSEKETYRHHGYGYVLEVGDGQGNYKKILEVLSVGVNAIVNRLEVVDQDFLRDLIDPFLTEESRSLLPPG